jgi:hypothetical protein
VTCGTFLADVLSDLEFAKLANNGRADDEPHEQRRQTRERGAKRHVPKNTEGRKIRKQLLVEQPVEQNSSEISI